MKTRLAIGAALLGGGTSFAGALHALHSGAADPTTEGFVLSSGGAMMGASGPLFDDGSPALDCWFTDDEGTASSLNYSRELTEDQVASMAANGFRLAAHLRTPSVSDDTDLGMTIQVENGQRQFLLRFGSTANPFPLVVANGDETFFVVAGEPGEHHLYELIDDDADGDADFYIDGMLRLADYAGVPATGRLVAFGDTSSTAGVGGRAHWSMVVLESLGGATCVGDVNGDGFIGFADLNAIVSFFNSPCPGGCPQDVNGDEFVGFADLNIVVSAFNTDCP